MAGTEATGNTVQRGYKNLARFPRTRNPRLQEMRRSLEVAAGRPGTTMAYSVLGASFVDLSEMDWPPW